MSETRPQTTPTPASRQTPADPPSKQIRRSIFRHSYQDTPANRTATIKSNLWLHLHPTKAKRASLRFSYTLCAGGVTFLLFLITVITGVILLFHYRPSPIHAHADLVRLTQEVPFGAFLRSLHRYAGDGMVIMVFVHMIRVFITGSYKPPREFNWVIGVTLLTLTLAIAFTGYLLPWEEKGYWATTVATNLVGSAPLVGADGPGALVSADRDIRAALLGGTSIGEAALIRFYVLHCFLLPVLAGLLMALHFWRVRKDGFSGPS